MNDQHSAISIKSVTKKYGDFLALKNISLEIAHGELFTLLGPSGCGKTSLLRLIAGFEETTQGQIFLFNDEIENLPANKRPINTVFQQYALFPHMTVAQNVQFGMRMLKYSKSEQKLRSSQMLELVQLEQFAHRKPHELSGGQQQRVALARALAPKPKVLLLDEPLSALDLKLRQAMRMELKHIQRETGITFVFVTHDQEEALTMSDRIAVMSAGKLQQVGTARDIYEEPANAFVADFIGETNLIDAEIESQDLHSAVCRISDDYLIHCKTPTTTSVTGKVTLSVRPERLNLAPYQSTHSGIEAVIAQIIYIGTDTQYVVRLRDGTQLTARIQNNLLSTSSMSLNDKVIVSIDHSGARILLS